MSLGQDNEDWSGGSDEDSCNVWTCPPAPPSEYDLWYAAYYAWEASLTPQQMDTWQNMESPTNQANFMAATGFTLSPTPPPAPFRPVRQPDHYSFESGGDNGDVRTIYAYASNAFYDWLASPAGLAAKVLVGTGGPNPTYIPLAQFLDETDSSAAYGMTAAGVPSNIPAPIGMSGEWAGAAPNWLVNGVVVRYIGPATLAQKFIDESKWNPAVHSIFMSAAFVADGGIWLPEAANTSMAKSINPPSGFFDSLDAWLSDGGLVKVLGGALIGYGITDLASGFDLGFSGDAVSATDAADFAAYDYSFDASGIGDFSSVADVGTLDVSQLSNLTDYGSFSDYADIADIADIADFPSDLWQETYSPPDWTDMPMPPSDSNSWFDFETPSLETLYKYAKPLAPIVSKFFAPEPTAPTRAPRTTITTTRIPSVTGTLVPRYPAPSPVMDTGGALLPKDNTALILGSAAALAFLFAVPLDKKRKRRTKRKGRR